MASNLPNDASTTVKATEQSALARLQTWGSESALFVNASFMIFVVYFWISPSEP